MGTQKLTAYLASHHLWVTVLVVEDRQRNDGDSFSTFKMCWKQVQKTKQKKHPGTKMNTTIVQTHKVHDFSGQLETKISNSQKEKVMGFKIANQQNHTLLRRDRWTKVRKNS